VSDGGAVTWAELLADSSTALGDVREARWICEQAGGFSAAEFAASRDEAVRTSMAVAVHAMVRRRCEGEPLQYVLGAWGFRLLDLLVDRRVLIPRPETEVVAGVAIDLVRAAGPGATAVDLGTGSGAIGLSIARELHPVPVRTVLTDASPDALDVARANLAGLGRAGQGVEVREGSWWSALPDDLRGSVDVAVSNPPYVAEGDPEVDESVRAWEPHAALYSDADGLGAIREIIAGAAAWLAPRGWLVLEIGWTQGGAVADLMRAGGLVEVEIRPDLAGHDRVALGRLGDTAIAR
jgi:release factor glutamine methyltransferase